MDELNFPNGWIESLAPVLKSGLQDFLRSYEMPFVRALRLNGAKPVGTAFLEPVPWEKSGRYLAGDSDAGAGIFHEAGCFYIQEPSAMAPVAALCPRPGETVLDLCAAPGGKATQIAAYLKGEGLLIANEPSFKRAQVLAQNLERMGVANSIAVSAMPGQLSKSWPGVFDAILVDAPCSGEGMFRRHIETRSEWTVETPQGCAKRQKEILTEAVKMLKANGRLCYSTCTFNETENEQVCRWLAQTHPEMRPLPFSLEGVGEAADGMLRLWPHKIRGEGHFVALFEKLGGEDGKAAKWGEGLKPASKEGLAAVAAFLPNAKPTALFGDTLVQLPPYPSLNGIKVLRAGLHLGQMRGKHLVLDHALAMAQHPPFQMETVALSYDEAKRFLSGEAIMGNQKGYRLATHEGVPLGFVKGSDGWLKNHYPKGLRKRLG